MSRIMMLTALFGRRRAPFQVAVVPINTKDEAQLQLAERIYGELKAAGDDVLLDDRNERPGVKFKDADLIGYGTDRSWPQGASGRYGRNQMSS